MSIQLTIPQMLSVLSDANHPSSASLIEQAVSFADLLAFTIEEEVPMARITGIIDFWDGEIMAGFNGEGPIPPKLAGYDDEGWGL